MLSMPVGTTQTLPDVIDLDRTRLGIVFVEPAVASLPDRQFLMLGQEYKITLVRGLRDLSQLPSSESFGMAVVSDTLGRTGMIDATRSIRKQWPSARILVLGQAAVVLEDHLYDDALPYSCAEVEVVEALRRMSGERTHLRPFIVSTPASELDSSRRQASAPTSTQGPDSPGRMTQTRSPFISR